MVYSFESLCSRSVVPASKINLHVITIAVAETDFTLEKVEMIVKPEEINFNPFQYNYPSPLFNLHSAI